MSPRSSASLLSLPSLLLLAACGLSRDIQATDHIRERIRARFGGDASVTAQTVNGGTTVTITLPRKPTGDASTVRTEIETVARAEFPSAKAIVIYAPL